jgi:tRNA threonylcarbamoyladenosine biosynthesis protein TsaB
MNKNNSAKPLIIAVETSGRYGSAAIAEGGQVLEEVAFSGTMRHSAELLGTTKDLLAKFGKKSSQIKQVYISVGPGSFTGLRIAVTFAKTMHLANNCRIVAVDSLDVIASNVNDKHERLGIILDAKRDQIFAATYELKKTDEGIMQYEKTLDDCLMAASEFIEKCVDTKKPIWLLGEGLVYHRDKFKNKGVEFLDEKYWWPKASKVHALGWSKARRNEFADAFTLQPLYLRQPQLGKSKLIK